MKKIGSFVPNELKIFHLLALSQIPKCLKDDDGEKFYKIYDFKKCLGIEDYYLIS